MSESGKPRTSGRGAVTSRGPIIITIPGAAVPFARAGSNGKRRFTPPKQAAFMALVRDAGKRAMSGLKPLEGPLAAQMRFVFVPPVSWSKKRREAAMWVTSKPDLDNLEKGILDSLGRRVEKLGSVEVVDDCVFLDDAQVASLTAQKVYGLRAEVVITVSELS